MNEITPIQEIIMRYPPEVWYEKKWVIALIGSLTGVILVTTVDALRRYLQQKQKIKTMAKNLYTEITITRSTEKRDIADNISTIQEFETMAKNRNFSYRPSILYMGVINDEYYKSYVQDLGLFDNELRLKIISFYVYLKSVVAVSKRIEDMFKRYYSDDQTIGYQDIVNYGNNLVTQAKAVNLIGAEIQAMLIENYKVDTLKDPNALKETKNKIFAYLQQFNTGDIISVEDLVNNVGTDELLANFVLLKVKGWEQIKYGKYKKT